MSERYEMDSERVAWCAGYPRSGTSLVRLVLANCFGQVTGSCYDETDLTSGFREAMRSVPVGATESDVRAISEAQGVLFWKTHAMLDYDWNSPAIVVIRDGRRVLDSLRHFYADYGICGAGMVSLIKGNHMWGSWSEWVRSWEVFGGSDALWLRYEDIVADIPGTVGRIGSAFGLSPIADSIPAFDSLRLAEPRIWRAGVTQGNGGMTAAEEEMFWALHGDVMARHGYYREEATRA